MASIHQYDLALRWTGNRGVGTTGYRSYDRDHELSAAGKPVITGSADPAFRGDASRWNPEELLVAALAQCHMLWFLHVASTAGVVVTDYTDHPIGTMVQDDEGGGGEFSEVVLRPVVTVRDPAMVERAQQLHGGIGVKCFISRSVSFPVHHAPTTRAGAP